MNGSGSGYPLKKSEKFSIECEFSKINAEEIEEETGLHITSADLKQALKLARTMKRLKENEKISTKTKRKRMQKLWNDSTFPKDCAVIMMAQFYEY